MDDDGGEQIEPGHVVVLALATVREVDTLVVPKLDRLARFVPDARAKEKLHGKQQELCRMHPTGKSSVSDLAKLFSISRPTVYHTLQQRHFP